MDVPPDSHLSQQSSRPPWLLILALWLAVLLLPMGIEVSGFVLGSTFAGIVLFAALLGRLIGRRSRPEPKGIQEVWTEEFKRIGARTGLAAALIVLPAEALLIARAWGERTGASWLPPVKAVQDRLHEALAPVIPALGELPAAMAREGFPSSRVGIVGGAFAVVYGAAGPLMAVLMHSFIRQLILHWRFGAYRWIPNTLEGRPFKRALLLLMLPAFFALVVYTFLFDTSVARLPRGKEWFADFETDDVALVYRSLQSLVLTSLSVSGIIYGIIYMISQIRYGRLQAHYRRLHPEWFEPWDQGPPQSPR